MAAPCFPSHNPSHNPPLFPFLFVCLPVRLPFPRSLSLLFVAYLYACLSPFYFCFTSRKVKGAVIADLGSHEIVSSRGNKSRAAMFALRVTEVLDVWPERHRNRKLVRVGRC